MAENREYLTRAEENGSINIAEDVVAAIAADAIGEIEGVGSMCQNMTEQITEQFTGKKLVLERVEVFLRQPLVEKLFHRLIRKAQFICKMHCDLSRCIANHSRLFLYVNEAVEIAKKYETPETVKFINGILGSFVRGEISAE